MIIRIADLLIEWQNDYSDFVKDFLVEAKGKTVLDVRFGRSLPECHGIQYCTTPSEKILRLENGEFACADKEWTEVTSYYPTSSGMYALPLAAICSRFSFYNAFLIHASCVSINGEGIVFVGNSGIGKTTQAELWQKYLGAEIINGDKAFIREINGDFYGCGLPWKGSSEYCLNKKTKLDAIVILRQSQENKLIRLNIMQATECLMPHLFMPHWDEKCLDNTLGIIDRLLEKVPVMLLECRPDEDAVKLVHNTVF